MVEEILGSRMRSDAFYGQNGSSQPSSQQPGDAPIKRSAVAKSIIAADGSVNPKAGMDLQTRELKGGNQTPDNVPTHPGMRSRSHEGGTIPASTIRRANAALLKR